ncbi:hypothetical protein BGX38DRAFT_1279198 [Terfezia claveryi]|nr:hypothetical protein BGX38DRAFT_1279198 [Terfezia claveryi]
MVQTRQAWTEKERAAFALTIYYTLTMTIKISKDGSMRNRYGPKTISKSQVSKILNPREFTSVHSCISALSDSMVSTNSTDAEQGESIGKAVTVQFDPEGDVISVLPCSEGTTRFQINSSILCLQSPVFREKLSLEISLTDDDPKALAIIQRILHLQHDWLPVSLDEDRV